MTHITNKIALFLCLIALAATTFAASEAEFGKLSKAWTLHADGSQEFRCNKELTLFTHTAMNGTYGETFIVYNPDYQELKIHSSYTKQKDGNIVKTPDNGLVEVLPRMAAGAPAFNQLKEMVVIHTGLELGATIYLDYSILTKPGYYPELDIHEIVEESSPVKDYSLSISVPESKPLHYQLYGASVKASETKLNGKKEIRWNLRNTPAFSHEPFQPQNGNNIPQLTVSTYTSQKEALASLDKKFADSKDYECKTFAQFITEQAKNDTDKVSILQKHVVNNLGNSNVTPENTGYTVRDADVVLRSAYGTAYEKTQLLNVLLNAAGVRSEIVAVYPGTLSAESCGLNAVKSLALKVTVDGKEQYLSASSLAPSTITARGELDNVCTLTGNPLQIAAIPAEVKEAKAVSINTDKAVAGTVICTLPTPSEGLDGWHMNGLNSRRTEMMELPSLLNEQITYTVTPAEGLKLQTEATTKTLSKPCGKVTRTITQKGNTIEVIRAIELNKQQFTPAEYGDLRALINEWTNPNSSLLLFSTN